MGLCHLPVLPGMDDMLMPPPNPAIPPHTVIRDGINLDRRLNAGRAGLRVILTKRRHGVLVRDREAAQMPGVQGKITHRRQDLDHHKVKNIPVELHQQGTPTVEIDQCPFPQDALPHLLQGRIVDAHLRGIGLHHYPQHVVLHYHLCPQHIRDNLLENSRLHLQTWVPGVTGALFADVLVHVHHVVALAHRPSDEFAHLSSVPRNHYHQ